VRCPGRVAAALLAAALVGCGDEFDDLQPDLLVTELSAPDQMQAGTSAAVRVTVWNRGVRKAGEDFKIVVEAASPLDPGFNSPVLIDELELSELAARAEITYYCGLTMPNGDEGVWSLRATADSENTVPEADELNNSALTTVWNEDELPPGFGSILCAPDPARAGVTIAIVFASSESLAATPDVTVDGRAATLASNTGLDYIYEYVVVGPGTETEGVVPVSVQGTDTASPGNDGIGATTVTLDFTDPTLGPVTASPDPAKAGDTLAITFDSTELLSTTSDVTVAGRPAAFVSESALTYTYSYVPLVTDPEGIVAIDVSAADPAGNPASSAGSMVFDFTLPTLSLLEVTPDLAKAGDTLSITFDSSEALSASTDVTVAGEPAAFVSESGPPYVYTYSYLALGSETEGAVTVDVTASDPAGNPGSISVGMTFDFTAPVISSLSVTPDTATPGDTLTITFNSDDPLATTPSVAIDSNPATFVTESALAYTYEYLVQGTETEGAVAIDVSTSDPVGNEGTGTGSVILDFRKPSLSAAPSPAMLYALSGAAGPVTSDVTLALSLGSNIAWDATLADSWLSLDVTAGVLSDGGSQSIILSADPSTLTEDLYVSTVTFAPTSATSDCEPFDLTVSFAVRPSAPGSGTLVYYTSIIDFSEQPYGLRLPTTFAGPGAHPVAVNMHGYGGGASTSFNAIAETVADANGWILVNVEGRGNHQYDGAAETDLFEVLADVDTAYGVDWTQVFLEGHSMGGTGALRFIARHPDVFAGAAAGAGWNDYRQWYRHFYAPLPPFEYQVHPSRWSNLEDASALRQVQNILTGRLYFSVGGEDPTNWAENGLKLEQRLIRLGTVYTIEYDPSGVHSGYPPHNQSLRYLFLEGCAPLDLDPDNVTIRANRLRTAKHAWLQVERFIWHGFAEVTATRAGTTFDIAARNVQRFTISSVPAPGTYSVTVNTVPCGSYSSFPVTIELAIDSAGIVTGVASPAGGLQKTPALEGPAMRALCDRFIVAYGSSGNATQTNANFYDAEDFCDAWSDVPEGFNAVIAPVDEDDLTRADIAGANLVIFGTEESSRYIGRMCGDVSLPFNLPVQILNDQITLGGQTYAIPTYGLWMTYPNPLAPDRLVVVGRGVYDADAEPRKVLETQETWPWAWPDYIVFGGNGQFAAAGHFDRDWSLPDSATPQTVVSFAAPATEGTSYADATSSITVTVDVTDELAAVVMGLDEDDFALRVDGEALAVLSWDGEIAAGRYRCALDISDLVQITSEDWDPTLTTYDLTVEVVRPGAGSPVVGIGRTRIMIAP